MWVARKWSTTHTHTHNTHTPPVALTYTHTQHIHTTHTHTHTHTRTPHSDVLVCTYESAHDAYSHTFVSTLTTRYLLQ